MEFEVKELESVHQWVPGVLARTQWEVVSKGASNKVEVGDVVTVLDCMATFLEFSNNLEYISCLDDGVVVRRYNA